MPQSCEVRVCQLLEGFNKEQERTLRTKKKYSNEEAKWLDMYKILFPDDEENMIPKPCLFQPRMTLH
jgi:hypothetical protein